MSDSALLVFTPFPFLLLLLLFKQAIPFVLLISDSKRIFPACLAT